MSPKNNKISKKTKDWRKRYKEASKFLRENTSHKSKFAKSTSSESLPSKSSGNTSRVDPLKPLKDAFSDLDQVLVSGFDKLNDGIRDINSKIDRIGRK